MAKKKGLDADVIEKERKVLELRLLGLTWDNIAKAVGYANASVAWKAYQRALVRTLQEPADEIRQQEVERLNRIMTPQMQRALNGDTQATNTVLKIMETRAKLLGLFAPTRIEAEVNQYTGGGDIDAGVARLAELVEQSNRKQVSLESREGESDTTAT